jgi:hypothetical protein
LFWYLVARSINPRLFLPDVANVSFVLRRGTLVSSPKTAKARREAGLFKRK